MIHKVHRENQEEYSFFMQSRDRLILCIRTDYDWMSAWLKDNPPPLGTELSPIDIWLRGERLWTTMLQKP